MKLENILPKMSKLYLNRVVSSFLKDVRIEDEDEMRAIVLRNASEFQNAERIKRSLDFLEDPRDIEVANELILICLIQYPDYLAPASQLVDDVMALQEQIVSDGLDDEYLSRAIPEDSRRIYTEVLKAAWAKDNELNAHEKNVLEVLRQELGLTRRHHRLLESKIGRFPQNGNKPFPLKQIEDSIKDLQQKGILLRFRTDDSYYVIPEEIEKTVRYFRGGELKTAAYNALLESLTQERLRTALDYHSRRVSGTKAELVERIQRFKLLPSQVLDALTVSDLNETMSRLDGIRKSGSKGQKIENIIDYFEALGSPETSDPTDDRAQYYDVFEEVASRDYASLRDKGLITKDIEVERLFEAATRYLFEKKFEIPLMEMPGTTHADGRVKIDGKHVLLWDNKSTETPYNFPDEHVEQFLGYIRADTMRPTVFLVVVSDYTQTAVHQAQKLKAFSETDTDVALVTAKDLKFIAENWRSYSGKKIPKFNLQLFNLTGELNEEILKARMSWVID